MSCAATIIAVLVLTASAFAQTALPKFEDYPASEAFHGKPAAPRLVRQKDRLYRTSIRQGAAAGPNFAGHLTVVSWGCGSGCRGLAIIDASTGEIYEPPFSVLTWGLFEHYDGNQTPSGPTFEPLAHRLDSNLLVVRGCPEEKNCATLYYVWDGKKLNLERKNLAAEPKKR